MAGSGTTLRVADRLGRIAVGTEVRKQYVAAARPRLSTEGYDRRDKLLPAFDSAAVCDNATQHPDGQVSPADQDRAVADGGDEIKEQE